MGIVGRLVMPKRLARPGKALPLVGAALLAALAVGCSALDGESELPSAMPHRAPGTPTPVAARATAANAGRTLQPVALWQPAPQEPAGGQKEGGKEKEEGGPPKQKITLPMAIELCVNNNFRVLAGAEKVRQAEGELLTSSLVPNPTLFADCQLIPLQRADIDRQLGPPQWDVLMTLPLDWLLFGKRLAAMQAARLGVEVTNADFANVLRVQLSQTVDAFYDVLQDEAYFKLAEKYLDALESLQKITLELAKNKKVGDREVDRVNLAVHEALLERHDRELALDLAKAKLRPFLGRTAADPDYEVEGSLIATAVVPPPKLADAVALAEANRPDLASSRRSIDQAGAVIEVERRKAKPVFSVQPGWQYQDQVHVNGFPNGSLLAVGVTTTLPLTDRNQGNIHKARAVLAERQLGYQGDRADALADVEAAVASYADAVEHLTLYNTPATLKAAKELRKNSEAAYRAGNVPLVTVLDDYKAYRDRLGHVIEFESTYWRTLNRLNAAVGLKAYDPERGPTQPISYQADKKK
jgi:cobalt-zinc-cadmium efflux system outer membrane protein